MCREISFRIHLVALITEDIPRVVELREARDVTDVAGEPVLPGEGRDRLSIRDEPAPVVPHHGDQAEEHDEQLYSDAVFHIPLCSFPLRTKMEFCVWFFPKSSRRQIRLVAVPTCRRFVDRRPPSIPPLH